MRKTVLTFGLISGAIISAMLLLQLRFHDQIGFDRGFIVGYTSMVLAFLLIFFGVRSYRDNVAGGTVRFGRALAVGALIGVVSSSVYVATWEVVYYNGLVPDFFPKYREHVLTKAREGGATEEALARQAKEMAEFEEMYKNPAVNVAFSFMEPLPVALVVALVTAGVLSRKRKEELAT